ncbi:MAG TPA: hybrid sensor histidine kinase/response regulator [Ktedonobacteraceae bacterium]|nr:hybrid sensor histidine kinase/response regulator [Ktedonobacteraceae bacterium]
MTLTPSPCVLIVDDDTALLQALPLALALRLPGIQVETSDSAIEALSRIQQRDYDTVVTDIKMPGMDGLALLARIKELRPDTPTLLITGHGEHNLAIEALRGGAYDFIQKPIDRDYFVAALQRAMQTYALRRQVQEQQRALEEYAHSLEALVQERTRELVQANATKDEFLSLASHELRTPLSSLKAMIQVLLRRQETTGVVRRPELENMERSVRRMELLVNDLLNTSLLETGMFALHMRRCDLVTLCRRILEEHVMGTNVRITFVTPSDPIEVEVDVDRISQVVLNLLSNARKYSSVGAPISLILERREDTGVLMVQDQGVGIPQDQLPHIFERFYRVPGIERQSGSNVGLGLGLYIAQKIVECHKGRIEVSSHPGNGSTFSVILPLADEVHNPPQEDEWPVLL